MWARRIAVVLLGLTVLALGAYLMRTTLMLHIAKLALDRDASMKAQELEDGVAIVFAPPPSPWFSPLKNEMNEIWSPAKLRGINYYTFAGPATWLASFSGRSDPRSPYYQAWVGGYVVKMPADAAPQDPETLIRELTTLDQRSWLDAMGDTKPMVQIDSVERAGQAVIDGSSWPLWHATYRSHSDLSARPQTQLAQLLGMPAESAWPAGVTSFHEVALEGYMATRVDTHRHVAIVLYECLASYPSQPGTSAQARERANDVLLQIMKSARLRTVIH